MSANQPVEERAVTPFGHKQNEITERDGSAVAIAKRAEARVQSPYVMALKKPRDIEQARIKILRFCEKLSFAEKAEYAKPIDSKTILRGPSIRFAETALREFGNIVVDMERIFEDDESACYEVSVRDVESNVAHTTQFTVRKTVERKYAKGREVLGERLNSYGDTVYIVRATEDEILNKVAALKSKAIRNEGLRLLPSDIIEEAMEACKDTRMCADKNSDPDKLKRKMIDAFAEIGVSPGQLASYLGHTLEKIQPAERQDLLSIHATIKSGEARWKDYYDDEADDGEEKKPKPKKAAEKMDSFAGKKAEPESEKPTGEKTLLDE